MLHLLRKGPMPVYDSANFPQHLCDSPILIVGGGAVGLAMAASLARRGVAVTVLEGGPPEPPADFESRNRGPSRRRPYGSQVAGRMKALGGTTRLWGGQLVPFGRADIDALDEAGRRRWPISADEFVRWIGEAYECLGVPVEARDTMGLWRKATGRDPALGHGLTAHMNVWLGQPDFTRLFAAEIAGPLVRVVTGAEVRRLTFGADGRVEAVEVAMAGGDIRSFRAGEVVLAGGTLEIVRLLLRMAATDPACPFRGNAHIGHWFMDHLHGVVGTLEDIDRRAVARLFDTLYVDGRKYNVKVRREDGEQRAGQANIAMTLNAAMTLGDMRRDGMALARRLFSGPGGFVRSVREGVGMARVIAPVAWRYIVRKRAATLMDKGLVIGVELEQLPTEKSYLFLDPAAAPEEAAIGVAWDFDGRELASLAEMAERFVAVFAENGLGRVVLDPAVPARDPALFDRFSDAAHQMGGARMADSPDRGVTDSECRVFGASNLSIAGAAVFPSGSFANSTLSAIALGLRIADRIAGTVQGKDNPMLMSRLVYGTARLTGGASERGSLRLVEQVLAAGVRAIDVAPSYGMGTAESVVGKALARSGLGGQVEVIAKIGSHRDPKGPLKTWLRAAKRLVKKPGPRSLGGFEPLAPQRTFAAADLAPEALRGSYAVAKARLGRIDTLLLHEAGPGEVGPAQQALLGEIAADSGARTGYAISCHWEEALDADYPAGSVAETAIDPAILTGKAPPPVKPGVIFHSVVPTADWLARTDPAFAAALEKAAGLITGGDPATARIAAIYALAAERAPSSRFVFASTDPARLASLLAAFAAIDAGGLAPAIAACFG